MKISDCRQAIQISDALTKHEILAQEIEDGEAKIHLGGGQSQVFYSNIDAVNDDETRAFIVKKIRLEIEKMKADLLAMGVES